MKKKVQLDDSSFVSGSSNATTADSSSVDKRSNDGSDGGGENVGQYEYNSQSSLPLSPFTGEE